MPHSILEHLRRSGADRRQVKTVKGRVLPGVDLTDRDKLFDVMDGR